MCKYNNHFYWEHALFSQKDIYKHFLIDTISPKETIFINTTIIDYNNNIFDNNWGCYSNIKALLGFIQYIYIPSAFYHIINKDTEDILIPICSSNELIEHIREMSSEHNEYMENTLLELTSYWELEDHLCLTLIKDFCNRFNSLWNIGNMLLYINIFLSPLDIAQHIISKEDFIEVFEEELGMRKEEFISICNDFYKNKFIQRTFVDFLNNKVGCIV